ncbi:hypothetical protein H312_00327 [Anncaliia algerae PRA339]|uniref:Histone H4 n=2 Tax=Opisthokonta TaxID=33154 RepID=A0A059F5M5_9MICR|nr:hypothetical protein H312_00327 [Anncaliia algerae PRA339]
MAGPGQVGRGKVAGKSGKVAAKRHRKQAAPADRISKPALRRLARRGGVKRLSDLVYKEMTGIVKNYLTKIVQLAINYAAHCKRKTVYTADVLCALKSVGIKLVGYN